MPKDATKNVDRYKIRGGGINEFEFHQNQEQFVATKGTKKAGSGSKKSKTAQKRTAKKAAKK